MTNFRYHEIQYNPYNTTFILLKSLQNLLSLNSISWNNIPRYSSNNVYNTNRERSIIQRDHTTLFNELFRPNKLHLMSM